MTDNHHSPVSAETDQLEEPERSPALTIDWESYEHYLEDSDLSEAEKRAFIETMWSIMVSFVDLGFNLSPTRKICGEVDPLAALTEKSIRDVVKLEDTNMKFNEDADGPSPVCEEGVADES